MTSKPNWVRPLDIASFGGCTLVVAVLSGLAITQAVDISFQMVAILITVTLVFAGIWARLCQLRVQYLNQFVWYEKYGFMVDLGGLNKRSDDEFNAVIGPLIAKWDGELNGAEKTATEDVNWVWFEKGRAQDGVIRDMNGVSVYGFTISGSRSNHVGYTAPDEPLTTTALQHEFGHTIYGNNTGNWDQETEHKFIKEHNLP